MTMNTNGPGNKGPKNKGQTGDSRAVEAQLRDRIEIEGPILRLGNLKKGSATITVLDDKGNVKAIVACREGGKFSVKVDDKKVTIGLIAIEAVEECGQKSPAKSEKEEALAVLEKHLEHVKDILEYGMAMNGVSWRGDDYALAGRIKDYDLDAKDVNDAIAKADKSDSKVISILEQLVKLDPSVNAAAKKALEKASQGMEEIEAETVLEDLINNIPSAPIPFSYPSNSEAVIAAISKADKSDPYIRELLEMILDLEILGLKSNIISAAKKALEENQ